MTYLNDFTKFCDNVGQSHIMNTLGTEISFRTVGEGLEHCFFYYSTIRLVLDVLFRAGLVKVPRAIFS